MVTTWCSVLSCYNPMTLICQGKHHQKVWTNKDDNLLTLTSITKNICHPCPIFSLIMSVHLAIYNDMTGLELMDLDS